MIATDPDDLVLAEVNSGVATLMFNRPSRKNAWSLDLELRYFELLDSCVADPHVRAIVVTATGDHFCPGLDVQRLREKAAGVPPPLRTRPISYPLSICKPVVAAINGTAAGLGLVMAALCDVRFASVGARMTTTFTRRGLPAEHLLSWLLPRIVGHGRASDLLLSGRIFTAEEGASMGFVNRVVDRHDLLPVAEGYALELAEHCSPLAMAQVKRQLLADWTATTDESLRMSGALKADPRGAIELAEGVASLAEKRSPNFAGLDGDPTTA